MALYQLDHIVHRYKDRPVLSIEAWEIDEGRIVQRGTFHELTREEGLFRELMARQMI